MKQFKFSTFQDTYPLVGNSDELMIVHRDSLAISATLYIGAHEDSVVEIRSAGNRESVEIATAPAVGVGVLTIPAGGRIRFDLPGTGNPLHLVTKLSALSGKVYVHITSFGVFDAYFKQVDVVSI